MVIYALMLIGIMIFRPQGLLGTKELSVDSLSTGFLTCFYYYFALFLIHIFKN